MPSVSIKLAGPSDNADLLSLIADMPMPGPIRITYQRKPSYFDALAVEGDFNQVMIGRDAASGDAVGVCNRSVKNVYVNGKIASAGYISGLRLLPQHRGNRVLAQGYAFLKELHKDHRTTFYLASVVRDNKTADILSKKRKYFPHWEKVGSFRNMAIALNQRMRRRQAPDVVIRNARYSDRDRIAAFLNSEGRRRQLYPVYTGADLFSSQGLLKNLNPEDICLAFKKDDLCGVAAGWDQQDFRSSVIHGYDGLLSLARPIYNIGARIIRKPRLPAVHSTLNYFYLSLICVRGEDTSVFADLVGHIMRQRSKNYEFMMTGMSENDPLLGCLTRYRHINYPADLFRICLEPHPGQWRELDNRIPYLEIGAL